MTIVFITIGILVLIQGYFGIKSLRKTKREKGVCLMCGINEVYEGMMCDECAKITW